MKTTKMNTSLTPADEGFAAAKRDNQAAAELHDEQNPDFLFSMTWTDLLVKIAKGEVDAEFYARKELANRGLDLNGRWIGFRAAAREHKV